MCPAGRPYCSKVPSAIGVSGVVGVHAIAEFPTLAGVHSVSFIDVFAIVVGFQSVDGIAIDFPTASNISAFVGVAVAGESAFAAIPTVADVTLGHPCCCYEMLLLASLLLWAFILLLVSLLFLKSLLLLSLLLASLLLEAPLL